MVLIRVLLNNLTNSLPRRRILLIFFTIFSFLISLNSLNILSFLSNLSIVISLAFFLTFLYAVIIYCCYIKKGVLIDSKNIQINCFFGDILKIEDGIKLIPVESSFENKDTTKISQKSLQYKILKNVNIKSFKKELTNELAFTRINQSIICFSAITLNNKKEASCTYAEYINLIYKVCGLIKQINKKQHIYIPIIGSGFKKEGSVTLSSMDCMNIIINTLKVYNFGNKIKVSIVIYNKKHTLEDMNLFLVK